MADVLCSVGASASALNARLAVPAYYGASDNRSKTSLAHLEQQTDSQSLTEWRKILEFATPSVCIMVQNAQGKQRQMSIQDRRFNFVYLMTNFLAKRLRMVSWPHKKFPKCQICYERATDTTILVNPHVQYNPAQFETSGGCQHVSCLRCTLLHTFESRGMLQNPCCPYCRQAVDESWFAPFCVGDGWRPKKSQQRSCPGAALWPSTGKTQG